MSESKKVEQQKKTTEKKPILTMPKSLKHYLMAMSMRERYQRRLEK